MTQAALEVDGLSVVYAGRGDEVEALHDVSFRIAPGEAYGLVGESGCGKSTVALAVVRYLPRNGRITAGTVRLGGDDLTSLPAAQLAAVRGRRIAMVYQDPAGALNPTLPVGLQVAEVFSVHARLSRRAADQATAELLGRVALPDPVRLGRRYPHELSGGQQQRVVIAMALAAGPEVLVLDEPTTGLDATVEAAIVELIADLRRATGVAVLFISHDLGLVADLCDRVGVLYAGRLVAQDTAAAVFARPRHPYTLGLARSVVRLGTDRRQVRAVPIPGEVPVLGALPAGCTFAPRCAIVRPACTAREPDLAVLPGGSLSRCIAPDEVSAIPLAAPVAPAPAPPQPAPPAPDRPLLRIEGLVKRHGAVTACDDVAIDIGRGETFGLVGESGSGKTTLARCIVGLERPDAGRVLLDGAPLPARVTRRGAAAVKAVQMVFQNPDTTLNPRRTVGAMLARTRRRLGGTRALADMVTEVGLDVRHLRARPAQLSGGQRQRVAIARALAADPDVVVCDEPVSALDVSVQATVLNLLADLQRRRGVSYLFISHDLAVVRYLADRVGVLYRGQLVEVGAASAVFAPPSHPYTEALLSAAQVLDPGEQRPPRERVDGLVPDPANLPAGCRFASHCPRRVDGVCDREAPPLRQIGPDHLIRCHLTAAELLSPVS